MLDERTGGGDVGGEGLIIFYTEMSERAEAMLMNEVLQHPLPKEHRKAVYL